ARTLTADASGRFHARATTHATLTRGAADGHLATADPLATPVPRTPREIHAPVTAQEFSDALWTGLLSGAGCALRPVRPADVPGGDPAADTATTTARTVVLDDRLRPAPTGIPGELYLPAAPGDGLPHHPAGTAVQWIPDPIGPAGSRLLRTGRRAMRTPDGALRDLGVPARARVGGYRPDTDRLSATLSALPGVHAAATLVREDSPGQPRLTGYVVPLPGTTFEEAQLLAQLADRLPEFMLPGRLVPLPELPVGPDGRLAATELPDPDTVTGDGSGRANGTSGNPGVVPREQQAVGELFREVLGGKEVGAEDNFFRVGGHSLLAVRLVNRVRAVLGTEITLRDVFRNPTVAALSTLVSAATTATPTPDGPDRAAPASPAPVAAGAPANAPARPALRRRTQRGARTRDDNRRP
ncbi:phosphopantetheine-binding protein, partial [Streptomyces sp. SM14]|uniref:phosphopantetheine-binding protein n=1 Tax=Streptomyces sp. SM14 TaxID=1736045 RepID=UPI0021565614